MSTIYNLDFTTICKLIYYTLLLLLVLLEHLQYNRIKPFYLTK